MRILPALASRVILPVAVRNELDAGRAKGVDLPVLADLPWLETRAPVATPVLGMVTDLGPGESEVIALALEDRQRVAILDDAVARRWARVVGIRFTGTLGLLIDAKNAGLIAEVRPVLDPWEAHRFRIDASTRERVLRLVGERP